MEGFEPRTLNALDYVAFVVYIGLNLGIGWWFARKKQTSGQFFLGNKIAWWAIGISFYATATSSISFMALPAMTYAGDWLPVGAAPAQAAAVIVIAVVFVGLLRLLNATTIYEYLERRFDRRVRLLGASLGILMTIFGRMSIVLLLPALAISTVTGLNVYIAILLMGVVTIVYSMSGGFSAVIWTDVVQSFIMLGGVVIAFIYIIAGIDGGFGEIFRTGSEADKFEMISWSLDLSQPTVLVFIAMGIGSIFAQMADQSLMQRVFATADVRDARRTLLLSAAVGLPSSIVFFFVGSSLWSFYMANPDRMVEGLPNDAIFPYFISNELPHGIVGIIIAGIFAAAMSTLSSAVNSTSAIIVRDFYSVLRPDAPEVRKLWLARAATLVAGVVATGMAIYLASLDIKSLWEMFLKLVALVGGGFPGVFALGFLVKRATATGAICGAIGSILVTLWVQQFTTASVFLHTFVAITACFLIGWAVSLLQKPDTRNLTGLTLFTLRKQ